MPPRGCGPTLKSRPLKSGFFAPSNLPRPPVAINAAKNSTQRRFWLYTHHLALTKLAIIPTKEPAATPMAGKAAW